MALNYLQARGIAHRDVRSDNLLVNQSGIVKLGAHQLILASVVHMLNVL